jgi:hypothetical protein
VPLLLFENVAAQKSLDLRRSKIVKKTLIAALASLMLAGALCAVDGATPVGSTEALAIIGDGYAPAPASMGDVALDDSAASHSHN